MLFSARTPLPGAAGDAKPCWWRRLILALPLSFRDCEINLERRELWRAKRAVHVEPQVFDLLVYLVQNRDRAVSKHDLIASVWGGRIVSESTLTSRINAARTAVGDNGREQQLIRTIPPQGFALHRRRERASRRQPAGPSRRSAVGWNPRAVAAGIAAARPARHRRASFHQYERRSVTRIFFRRDQRGHHHCAGRAALVLRDCAQFFIHLQGQGRISCWPGFLRCGAMLLRALGRRRSGRACRLRPVHRPSLR